MVNKVILHIIVGLDTGGTETMLLKLLSNINKDKYRNIVISFLDIGVIGEKIFRKEIPVHSLRLKKGIKNLFGLFRLFHIFFLIHKYKPDIIQTWMYRADLFGLLIGKLMKKPVIWNIRCSNVEVSRITEIIIKLCALFSEFPDAVIINSYAGKEMHERIGYKPKKWLVIPNGFDFDLFSPKDTGKFDLCKELNIDCNDILIGMIARYDPIKDHETFLKAIAILIKYDNNIQAVLVGDNVCPANDMLIKLISNLNIENNVHLLGLRDNMPNLTSALDILVSSSYGEGFPNVVGEAMACGVPCVVTNAGDSARIVGDTGFVVIQKSPEALAEGIKKIMGMSAENRKKMGMHARQRIIENYSINKIVKKYEKLYDSVPSL